jgi:hypothetical protein
MGKGYYKGAASPVPECCDGEQSPTQASLEWGTRKRKLKISDFRLELEQRTFQQLKPALSLASDGRAEARPLQKPSCETA